MSSKVKKSSFFSEWIVPVLIAVVLAFLINKFIIFKVKIPSESMVPTLNVNDRLFVTRVYNPQNLKRGDVVVFYSEELEQSMIKRLIGKPGDINYIGEPDKFNGEYVVPEGEYFFLGDNRLLSKDSRYWQDPYIPAKDIMGKAQLKVYPFSDFGIVR